MKNTKKSYIEQLVDNMQKIDTSPILNRMFPESKGRGGFVPGYRGTEILVIHPDDRSTDFLKPIYAHLTKEATVVTGGITKERVRRLMKKFPRVIGLGHGSPGGLFSMGCFLESGNGMIIDSSMVEEMKGKENVFIWCHASSFTNSHPELTERCYRSSMFISEVAEARMFDVPTTQKEVTDSCNLFVSIIRESIAKTLKAGGIFDTKAIYEATKRYYNLETPVCQYNRKGLQWGEN